MKDETQCSLKATLYEYLMVSLQSSYAQEILYFFLSHPDWLYSYV